MRFGNAVGKAPFKNTNRKDPKYTKRARKMAKKLGFPTLQSYLDAKAGLDKSLD